MLSNQDHWNIYTSNLPSPQIYLDWSFYYMIGAALQRRVWVGDIDAQPLFPNLYVALVGDPGIGKTQATKPTSQFLSYWKKGKNEKSFFDPNEFDVVGKILDERQSLIQVAPNATTYEALCRSMSRSIASHHFPPLPNGNIPTPYPHSSLCFTLEEFASLVRKHSEDVINFLLQAYDCGSYSYETLSRGKDFIKNPCLSLLAGTTFDFLRKVFGGQDSLLGGGIASRMIFVVADKPRFRAPFPIPLSEEQRKSGLIVLDHIKKLTKVYGRLDFGAEAIEYFTKWWKEEEEGTRINNSPKLKDYYARKNITVIKLAMILWFIDHDTLKVEDGTAYIKKAIEILRETEIPMHTVLTFDNKNPIAQLAKDIAKDVAKNGPKSLNDIIIDHFGDAPEGRKSIEQAIEFLVGAKKLKQNGMQYVAIIKEEDKC